MGAERKCDEGRRRESMGFLEAELLGTVVGGSSNYEKLKNKPKVNGVELVGDKSGGELGLANVEDVPTKTSDLANDSGFIDNTVSNLVNYYTKSETYTKAEVDRLLGDIKTVKIAVVASLPVASAETDFNESKTIYLVPASGGAGDFYDEYITLRTGSAGAYVYSWEKIGNARLDLSGYVQKTMTIAGVDLQDNITTGELQVALEDSTHRFVSDAEKENWDDKQAELVSGENIKTINNESVLGGGDIQVGYPVIEGSAAPTSATVGKVGQWYLNTTDSTLYQCRGVVTENAVTIYNWVKIANDATYETYTIPSWTALSDSEPYAFSATVTATYAIGSDTVVELINDQAVLFANCGFAIGDVTGQNITIYAVAEPSESVGLTIGFRG